MEFIKRVYQHLTRDTLAKVLFFSAVVFLGFLIINLIFQVSLFIFAAFGALAVWLCASVVSAVRTKRGYNSEIEKIKKERIEKLGENPTPLQRENIWTPREQLDIRKKTREHRIGILVRVVLVIFLLVLLFNML